MQLPELERLRNLYRRAPNQIVNSAGDSLSYRNMNTLGNASTTSNNGVSNQPANAVSPGTVIVNAIWSTSNSSERITLTPDDKFTVYRDGDPYICIDSQTSLLFVGYGITEGVNISGRDTLHTELLGESYLFDIPDDTPFAQDYTLQYGPYSLTNKPVLYIGTGKVEIDAAPGTFDDESLFLNDSLDKLMCFNGVPMGNYYRGYVLSTGAKSHGTSGWTSTLVSPGVYEITFSNPALATTIGNWNCVASPVSGHYRCKVDFPALNVVRVSWQQSVYGSQTFGVSGGGGGSVTVSGIYQGETPVNTSFSFIATRRTI